MGYASPAMGFPFHCNSAGVAARRVGMTGLSAAVGAAVLTNVVIVVKMTLAVVTAWIAILIMLIVVVSLLRRRCLLTAAPQWIHAKRALSRG